jgi:hypothetical protein
MKTLSAQIRPHFETNCWCGGGTCECCGGEAHKFLDARPDIRERMAVFSDQRYAIPVSPMPNI